MDPKLAERLTRLDALSHKEVSELHNALVREFDRLDRAGDLDGMQEAHDAIAVVREAQANDDRGRALVAAVHRQPPPRPSMAAANRRRGTAVPRRTPDQPGGELAAPRVILASGAEAGDGLAAEFSRVAQRMRRGGRDGDEQLVGRVSWKDSYPEERRLTGDPRADTAKVEAVTAPEALVASGGICGPVDVLFDIPSFSVADRPLRDALPSFQATRGGLRFVSPPTLAETASGIAIWTEATDANPAAQTKPYVAINCPVEVETYVDAVVLRVRMGNMLNTFDPELAQAFLNEALAQEARVAEVNLLEKISSYSTPVSTGQLLGASRDLLATLDQAAAAYRYRQRLSRATKLRAIFPEWAKDMVRADLTRELAHGDDVSEAMQLSDDDVDALLTARGVAPIWTLDGLAAGGSGLTYPAQTFGTQTANAALADWPHQLVWWLYAEGSFQFLDGGELDIRVVRDSVLNNTNDLESFIETFEGRAFRGTEALQLVSSVRPNGGSAGSINTTTY